MNTRYHPFSRVIGIDRIFAVAEALSNQVTESGFPPHNIVKVGENDYTIELAVAGFSVDELTIETKERVIVVTGERKATEGDGVSFLYRGIANRSFRREFPQAEFVEVQGASLKNGILSISLKREVPENQKHRKVDIVTASAQSEPSEASVG
jgi:molecular chaperone IbpA